MTTVDARGMRCPWPAIRAGRALRDGADAVDVLADDPAAARELAALAVELGLDFAALGGAFRFRLTRRDTSIDP